MSTKNHFIKAVLGKIIPTPGTERKATQGYEFFVEPKGKPDLRVQNPSLDALITECAKDELFIKYHEVNSAKTRIGDAFNEFPVAAEELIYFSGKYRSLIL